MNIWESIKDIYEKFKQPVEVEEVILTDAPKMEKLQESRYIKMLNKRKYEVAQLDEKIRLGCEIIDKMENKLGFNLSDITDEIRSKNEQIKELNQVIASKQETLNNIEYYERLFQKLDISDEEKRLAILLEDYKNKIYLANIIAKDIVIENPYGHSVKFIDTAFYNQIRGFMDYFKAEFERLDRIHKQVDLYEKEHKKEIQRIKNIDEELMKLKEREEAVKLQEEQVGKLKVEELYEEQRLLEEDIAAYNKILIQKESVIKQLNSTITDLRKQIRKYTSEKEGVMVEISGMKVLLSQRDKLEHEIKDFENQLKVKDHYKAVQLYEQRVMNEEKRIINEEKRVCTLYYELKEKEKELYHKLKEKEKAKELNSKRETKRADLKKINELLASLESYSHLHKRTTKLIDELSETIGVLAYRFGMPHSFPEALKIIKKYKQTVEYKKSPYTLPKLSFDTLSPDVKDIYVDLYGRELDDTVLRDLEIIRKFGTIEEYLKRLKEEL